MCVIKFNGTHTLQGFHEDDHRIVRRTCEFFCGYIVLAGQRQAPAAAIKSLYFYRLFDVPTTQSEGHLSRMRTSLLWTKLLFSDKIEFFFLVHVMIKLIKWDGILSDEANVLLLYIYIYIYHVKLIIFQLNCRIHSASSTCIELFTELYAANIQRCRQMSDFKKKGISINFIGIKLLNLSKDV